MTPEFLIVVFAWILIFMFLLEVYLTYIEKKEIDQYKKFKKFLKDNTK